ncbi:MAG: glycosyltransferase family protein, partial [candidate division NC10 bacterium]|nr:glycosyltransferase family protein [candidate division NC10 bacterium]
LPPGIRADYLIAKNTVRYLYPLGRINLVNTFYPFPHEEEEGVFFLGPILPREVLAAKESIEEGSFVLVYPKPPNERLFLEFIQGISHLDFIFYVRDPGRFQDTAHIRFKPFSPEGFLRDLVCCRFALSTAGHQLPCEALFLKKPMMVVPEGGQFEQFYNGKKLEEMGLGISVPLSEMRPERVSHFADRLESYRERLAEARIEDATPFALQLLQRELASLPSA